MNIQIFGKNKCFDTKKAMRYFKERKIPFQFIDLLEKGMSKGELQKVAAAVGGINNLVDEKAKDQDKYLRFKYAREQDKFEMLLNNQQLLKTPVVRNGHKAAVGYCHSIWQEWVVQDD